MTELLAEIFKGQRGGKSMEGLRIVLLWEESVSREIANQTEAIKVKNKILYVKTKAPVWSQELNLLKKELLNRINEKAGYIALRDIRFGAGG